jgi:hypothetical protein
MNSMNRVTAIVVCFMISPLAGLCQPQGGAQRAGQIDALIPAATRNDQTAKAKDEVDWNDMLKTAHSGRVRASLTDGSILSVGSDSQLRVVQHDAASQQTSLELNYGRVRNQVTSITKAGGKYELKTPNAVIGVIGTDFIALYKSNKTTVWCRKGRVKVTPMGKVAKSSGQQSSTDNSVTLEEGQMVVITSEIPSAGFQPSNTPPDEAQSILLSTDVPDGNLPPPPGNRHVNPTHGVRNLIIGGALATGLAVGLAVGTRGGSKGCTGGPTSGNCP